MHHVFACICMLLHNFDDAQTQNTHTAGWLVTCDCLHRNKKHTTISCNWSERVRENRRIKWNKFLELRRNNNNYNNRTTCNHQIHNKIETWIIIDCIMHRVKNIVSAIWQWVYAAIMHGKNLRFMWVCLRRCSYFIVLSVLAYVRVEKISVIRVTFSWNLSFRRRCRHFATSFQFFVEHFLLLIFRIEN